MSGSPFISHTEDKNLPANPGTLILRCDATTAMGTGHVMRCMSLAQAWQDAGGKALFAMAEGSPALRQRLHAENMEVVSLQPPSATEGDVHQVAELARRHGAHWLVVDGYQFGGDYQRRVKAAGLKLLFVDDHGHAGHYSADLVLDQNANAQEKFYTDRESYTRLLRGPRFVLLRREFAPWSGWKRKISAVGRKVLVTMGGSDPDNVSARAIAALRSVKLDVEAVIVVGGSNPHLESLKALAAGSAGRVRLQSDVSNMAELMVWADVALSAAGTTCWEMCLLGLPAILVTLADNQRPVAQELQRAGCASYLDEENVSTESITASLERLLLSPENRTAFSQRGAALVDGKGARRVISAMQSGALRIRPARPDDGRLLWEWANDPTVRASSFSPAQILWDQHQAWFAGKLSHPACRIFIAEDEAGKAVGQFRVDFKPEGDSEVDVSLARDARGAGYGSRLIDLAARAIFAESEVASLTAIIRVENDSSRRAFEEAGFRNLGEETVNGRRTMRYVRTRNSDAE